MRHAGLFEGIGGFPLAAERVGMESVWSAENDSHASRVLAHHWPKVPNLGDVHGIESPPAVDVLTGGFPCQDYSVAGNRAGLAGDRGALWWEFHRLIAELGPRWVVGENVPGLVSSRGGADFATIVDSLVELGYGVAWRVLDAQWFGVAQRRRRVFIVGHSGGEPRPEILALAQGVSGDTPPSREAGKDIAGTLGAGATGGSGPSRLDLDNSGAFIPSIAKTLGASERGVEEPDHATHLAIAATLTQGAPSAGRRSEDDVNLVAFAQNQRDELRELDQASSLNAERWGTAKNETLLAIQDTTRMSKDQNGAGVSEEGVGYTLDGQSRPGVADLVTVRRLTPLECERLQGFPDGWTDTPGNSDTQRYRQLGNAVAVPVAEWIMRRLVNA